MVAVANSFINTDVDCFLKNGSVKSKNEIMITISVVYKLRLGQDCKILV